MVAGRGDADGDVPHGRLLVRFADAAVRGSDVELETARREVESALGAPALVDAAAIAGIFSCNVRVADATGVPLDEWNAEVRERIGARVGIERYREPEQPAAGQTSADRRFETEERESPIGGSA